MERSTMLFMGKLKLTFDWAMFNSYVTTYQKVIRLACFAMKPYITCLFQ